MFVRCIRGVFVRFSCFFPDNCVKTTNTDCTRFLFGFREPTKWRRNWQFRLKTTSVPTRNIVTLAKHFSPGNVEKRTQIELFRSSDKRPSITRRFRQQSRRRCSEDKTKKKKNPRNQLWQPNCMARPPTTIDGLTEVWTYCDRRIRHVCVRTRLSYCVNRKMILFSIKTIRPAGNTYKSRTGKLNSVWNGENFERVSAGSLHG